MRYLVALTVLAGASTTAEAGELANAIAFTIQGSTVQGHTLTIAPVEGAPITAIDRFGFESVGQASGTIDDAYVEHADGRSYGLEGLRLEPAKGTTLALTDDGATLTGGSCGFAFEAAIPDAAYLGIGWQETDPDGLCDAVGGGKGLCGNFDPPEDDDCDRLGGSNFVFGQTVYGEARAAGGHGFVYGETVYMKSAIDGPAGKRVVSAELGTEQCHVGVWDDTGLVYAAIAPCAEIGGVSDPGGDPFKEVPLDQHFSLVWSAAVNAWVTKVVWTWTGGGVDVSYHAPGLAWVE